MKRTSLNPQYEQSRSRGDRCAAPIGPGDQAEPVACDSQAGRHGIWRAIELAFLRRMLARLGDPPLRVVLWNGAEVAPKASPSIGCLTIHDRMTLWKLAWNQSLAFGDAFVSGRLTIQGNLKDVLTALFRSMLKTSLDRDWTTARDHHRARGHRRSIARSRESVHHHYDIGNEFYKLWLDDQLVYTCAYFEEPNAGLAQAQIAKMDHVCRKLRLLPGQTVVEAGSGWGALALHMASRYGVTVKAFNLSREQTAYSRKRAEQAGLKGRVEFIEDDYRNISGKYDAFVSVGMLEHVGPENFVELGTIINRSLKVQGMGLIHSIGRNVARPMDPWTEKRIFPGACPPSLREMLEIFERSQFSVLDVENLRMHYVRTLELWLEQFEQNTDTVLQMFDEQFVRVWRLYLAASAATFAAGDLQLFQVVFSRSTNNDIPWTRSFLYNESPVSGVARRSGTKALAATVTTGAQTMPHEP